ncbi:adenylosuccinate synthase [Candidatus Daviesbacteria bacterium]|nr:adenylosuccinate synthase [Candidatus Daviesbacteria bacterium]
MSAEVIAVAGGQWGDEGKGKVVDQLAQGATVVVRAQGGDNAGHTVVNGKGMFALNLIPAGIFNPKTINILGQGTVVNAAGLIREMAALHERGISTSNLRISPKAHLVFEYHQLEDGHEENSKGAQAIGTTKRGIGPAYADKANRVGIRAEDLADPEECLGKIARVLKNKRGYHPDLANSPQFDPGYYENLLGEAQHVLTPLVMETSEFLYRHITGSNGRVLIEGAQGTLLSVDDGTYPMVTSSNTTINGLLAGAGIGARWLTQAIGVFKAYQTRVGGGPMPTERFDEGADRLRKSAHEFGVVSGRPRRLGWFDGVAAGQSQYVNGFTDIVITRLDNLSCMGDLMVCNSYILDGKEIHHIPSNLRDFERCQAAYGNEDCYPGWNEDLAGITDLNDLPEKARKYVLGIVATIPDARLMAIGNGQRREDLVFA